MPRGLSFIRLGTMDDSRASSHDSDVVYRSVMDCLLIKRSAQTLWETPDD